MKIVSFSLEQGNQYYGRIDGAKFFIGNRVSYQSGKGLMNVRGTSAQKYDRSEFRQAYGFWADFIHPTATAEGALYHTLNTYDRAHFTFSFLQYAAHVPNGAFAVYLRALLRLPLAIEYFPDLRLENDRIARVTDNGIVPLESDHSTRGLMQYLNPSFQHIEDTEVIQAARFVHWAQTDPSHRLTQVDVGIAYFRAKMAGCAERYGLDGKLDTICLVVADIRHQGRATSPAIVAALQSTNPLKSLLVIGEPKYHERLVVLRREINRLLAEGTLGNRKFSLANRDFIAA